MALSFTLEPAYTDGEDVIFTGSVTDFDGASVMMDIDLDDDGTPDLTIEVEDGGAYDSDGMVDGSIALNYRATAPYTAPGDYKGEICITDSVLEGEDLVFIIDSSGSTVLSAEGWSTAQDLNNNGIVGEIIDLQLAGLTALIQDIYDRGLEDTAKVSVGFFSSSGGLFEFGPDGSKRTWAYASEDADGNGRSDLLDSAYTLQAGGGTSFEAGLQQAVLAVTNAGTPQAKGTVVFNSDGFPFDSSTQWDDEVTSIKTSLGQNLRGVAVGGGSDLGAMQQIDPMAVQATSGDDYLDFLTGGTSESTVCNTFEVTVSDPIITGSADVHPESNPSPVNLRSKGVTPMAVYGSESLDTSLIDTATLLVNGTGDFDDGAAGSKFKYEDLDKDGYLDLLFKVQTTSLAGYFAPGDTTVFVTGDLTSGQQFSAMHDNGADPLKFM